MHTSSHIMALVGTCMVIRGGVLTPTISVLPSMTEFQVCTAKINNREVVLLSYIILVGWFALQHFGTHKVTFLFAPVVIAWLLCISAVGIYNVFHWMISLLIMYISSLDRLVKQRRLVLTWPGSSNGAGNAHIHE